MQALRELQPLLQSPQVGLAAKAALIHASGVAEDHDRDVAVMTMATELDVSSSLAAVAPRVFVKCNVLTTLRLLLANSGTECCSTSFSSPTAGNFFVAYWFTRAGQSLCRACAEAGSKRCCQSGIARMDSDPIPLRG